MAIEQGGTDSSGIIGEIESGNDYPSGTGSNGAITLTNADTAYAVPTVAPASKYAIVLYNGSDTDMYIGFEDSNANGVILNSGEKIAFDLGDDEQIFAYCAEGGKILTYTLKVA